MQLLIGTKGSKVDADASVAYIRKTVPGVTLKVEQEETRFKIYYEGVTPGTKDAPDMELLRNLVSDDVTPRPEVKAEGVKAPEAPKK